MVNQHFVSDLPEALKQIDLRLRDYKEKNKQATLLVLQSSKTTEELQLKGLTALLAEFPVLKLAPFEGDNDFPSLDWIRHACRKSIETQMNAYQEVLNEIQRARYSFIPVCNLGENDQSSLIDTLLARQLSLGNQLLWYSDTD